MTRFRFTLRELLFTVAALAAYLATARHYWLGSVRFFEEHQPVGWLMMAEFYILLLSPVVALGWKHERYRKLKLSTAVSAASVSP